MNDTVQVALRYASLGWAVFPIQLNSKIPHKGSNGCKDASSDPFVIGELFQRYPESGIGIATGRVSGIFVLDVDNKNGVSGSDTLKDMEQLNGRLPRTPIQLTPSGGLHYVFTYPTGGAVSNSAKKLGAGLDVRGDGGYIVGYPSVIEGKAYEWEVSCDPFEIPTMDAPAWLLSRLQNGHRDYKIELSKKDFNINDGNRNERLFEIGTVARKQGLTRLADLYAYLHTINMNHIKPPLPDKVVMTITEQVINFNEKRQAQIKNDEIFIWDKRTEKQGGGLKSTYRNACNFLKTDENFINLFRFNQFSHRVEITRKPFWMKDWNGQKTLDDNDVLQTKDYLTKLSCELSVQTIFEAIHTVSYANSYHPVRDYLNSLKWDGVHRVHSFFPAFMGSEDTNYTRFVGKMLFCSAVARIRHPGCKYDYMIIIEGDQGIGKSMSLKALGGDWFGEASLAERDKDTIDKIQGLWIVEVAELAVFKKKEIEDLKSFLSTQVDRSRLAYAHTTKDFPRQSVFVGTVNPDDFGYLRDMTGNRRFLPVLCGEINVDAIKENRDQLFAEACVLYEQGEVIYIDGSVDQDALIQQNMRLNSDAWEQPILRWLNDPIVCKDKDRVKTEDIWCHALNGELNRLSRIEQIRIATVMRKLGYISRPCRYNGETERRWVIDSDHKRSAMRQETKEPEFTE